MTGPQFNPYRFDPAVGDYFVGRQEILAKWQERLTPGNEDWHKNRSWIVIGPGGIGKSSLLKRMEWLGLNQSDGFPKYQSIYIDLGDYIDLGPDDFLEALESGLPNPTHLGTKMRVLFNLPQDASTAALGLEATNTLLKIISPSLAPTTWNGAGINISGLDHSKRSPKGISTRLAQIINKLIVLSEEQDHPVILLLDQLDKAAERPMWFSLTCQFLALAERIRYSAVTNIILVFGMRPDRKGELEYQIRIRLGEPFPINEFTFQTESLPPFSIDDAIKAILARSVGLIDYTLAEMVIKSIDTGQGTNPYEVQLGAMAIFSYLYLGNTHNDRWVLTQDDISNIIKDSYKGMVQIFQKDAIEWEILKCLSYHSGGLSELELAKRLNNNGISQEGVRNALDRILGRSDYWVLKKIGTANQLTRFTITHDLLREYIINQIPENENLIRNAMRTLEDGIWRFRNHKKVLRQLPIIN